MIDIIASAVAGMDSATRRFERGANAIARSADATARDVEATAQSDVRRKDDIARDIVDTITAKAQFKASAALVRVSDEMMSDLLEVQARREDER